MSDFNQVVIIDRTRGPGNVLIAVHPFSVSRLVMMMHPGSYGNYGNEFELPPYQRDLADALWEAIPGLSTLFFDNGSITLHHAQLFEDTEIVEAATEVVRPVLERTLSLVELYEPVATPSEGA